jgi:hypothetical protein
VRERKSARFATWESFCGVSFRGDVAIQAAPKTRVDEILPYIPS